jgi:hypothetical protein
MIELSHTAWQPIKDKLVAEYGLSILISYVCKNKLGFTVRDHKGWIDNRNYHKELTKYQEIQDCIRNNKVTEFEMLMAAPPKKGHVKQVICLDFYSDSQETWFRLKYL